VDMVFGVAGAFICVLFLLFVAQFMNIPDICFF